MNAPYINGAIPQLKSVILQSHSVNDHKSDIEPVREAQNGRQIGKNSLLHMFPVHPEFVFDMTPYMIVLV